MTRAIETTKRMRQKLNASVLSHKFIPVSEEPPPGGIEIRGGSIEIGALAQGPHSRASYKLVDSQGDQIPGEQREKLASLVHDLLATLQQHGNDLWDYETAQAAAYQISAELDHEHPDMSRIRRLLTDVATAAGQVAAIAAAVAAVQQAISG
jgi:hypothetical protein